MLAIPVSSGTLSNASAVLDLLRVASDVIPGPAKGPFKAITGCLGELIRLYETINKNKQSCQALIERTVAICVMIINGCVAAPFSPMSATARTLIDNAEQLEHTIHNATSTVHQLQNFGRTRRLMQPVQARDLIETIRRELDAAVLPFGLQPNPSLHKGLEELNSSVQSLGHEYLLEKLPHLPSVGEEESHYLESTRADLLDEIMGWVGDGSPGSPRVFRLTGPAGSGKTGIAHNVALRLKEAGMFGGAFYFKRDEAGLAGPERVISTLAYALAGHNLQFRIALIQILKADSSIPQAIDAQFRKLLLAPFNLQGFTHQLCLILDALDQCGTYKTRDPLLAALVTFLPQLPACVKLFVTSLPLDTWFDIDHAITGQLGAITHRLSLGSPQNLDDTQHTSHKIAVAHAPSYGETTLQSLEAHEVTDHLAIVQQILNGSKVVISHPETSQYSMGGNGTASCGLAAMNCAKCFLTKANGMKELPAEDVLSHFVSRETVEEILSICKEWQTRFHLDVEDLHGIPFFSNSLEQVHVSQGQPGATEFRSLFREQLSKPKTSIAIVITRPPEIVCCVKLHLSSGCSVFVIFDSHPRPSHPHGAGLILSTSIHDIVWHLAHLFVFDSKLLQDENMAWETQLFAAYSAHVFRLKKRESGAQTTPPSYLEPSLRVLQLRAEKSDLESQVSALQASNNQLQSNVAYLRRQVEHLQDENRTLRRDAAELPALRRLAFDLTQNDHATGNQLLDKRNLKSRMRVILTRINSEFATDSAADLTAPSVLRSLFPITSKGRCDGKRPMGATAGGAFHAQEDSELLAIQKQQEYEEEEARLRAQAQASTIMLQRDAIAGPSSEGVPDAISGPPLVVSAGTDSLAGQAESLQVACRMQQEFDEENRLIRALSDSPSDAQQASLLQAAYDEEDKVIMEQAKELTQFIQPNFECGICLEILPHVDVARIDGCAHPFCRNCLRSYISSELKARSFPIFCPSCKADPSNNQPRAAMSALAEQLGITETEYDLWIELEMGGVSVHVECRKCKRQAWVDKEQHELLSIIPCPFRDCSNKWCKGCQQTVGKGEHTCDGSKEMDRLVSKKGWKRCPGCQTPIAKSGGCNHISCPAPCNTQFCYKCGKIIGKWIGKDVDNLLTSHYSNCTLFHYDTL